MTNTNINAIHVNRIEALATAIEIMRNAEDERTRAAAETLANMRDTLVRARYKQQDSASANAAKYANLACEFIAYREQFEEFTNADIAQMLNLKTQRGDLSIQKAVRVASVLVDSNQIIKLENRKVATYQFI